MKTTDVGACIAQDDADGFVAAAIALADDTPRRTRLRESARAAVEALDPASVASSFSELLTELAARRAA
jgi:glycosyltransferase involved in cell wall biosynthesis